MLHNCITRHIEGAYDSSAGRRSSEASNACLQKRALTRTTDDSNAEKKPLKKTSEESFVKFETTLITEMANLLLITDSNFINNVGAFKGRKIKDLDVKSCQSRRAVMQEIHSLEEGIAVFSCLDMVTADIVKSTVNDVQEAVEFHLNQFYYALTQKVEEADGKLAIGIVAPMFWISLSEETRRTLNHVYKSMKKTPVKGIWISGYFRDIQTGVDGTHLTSRSGHKFIQHVYDFFALIGMASNLGRPELEAESTTTASVDWSEEMAEQDPEAVVLLAPPEEISPARTSSTRSMSILDMPERLASNPRPLQISDPTQLRLLQLAGTGFDFSVPPPTVAAPAPATLGDLGASLTRLEQRVGGLEAKSFFDSLMMASLKEEHDTEANVAMLNRVTISGVIIEGLFSMRDTDKVDAMKTKVREIINQLKDEGQEFQVLFVRHLNKQKRGQSSAVIEVRFSDEKQAKLFRSMFVKKQKELPEKINVTPVVRLATRVRVEMMHSISNLYMRHDSSISRCLCLQYLPKPVIKTVRKNSAGVEMSRTMTFIEAICWVKAEGLTRSLDLKKAYDRAGASFRGTLNQHFVLMN